MNCKHTMSSGSNRIPRQLTVGDSWATVVEQCLGTNNDIQLIRHTPVQSPPGFGYTSHSSGVQKVTLGQLNDICKVLKLEPSDVQIVGPAPKGFALKLSQKQQPYWQALLRSNTTVILAVLLVLLVVIPGVFLFSGAQQGAVIRTAEQPPHSYTPPEVPPAATAQTGDGPRKPHGATAKPRVLLGADQQ